MERNLFDDEHDLFRESFRRFVADEITPNLERWEAEGITDRSLFSKAGSHGFLGMAVPEEHGGGGVGDFRYNQVIIEEVQAAGAGGAGLGITLSVRELGRMADTYTDIRGKISQPRNTQKGAFLREYWRSCAHKQHDKHFSHH